MPHFHTRNEDEKLKRKIRSKIRKIKNKSCTGTFVTFLNGLKQRTCDARMTVHKVFRSSYWSVLHFISILAFCLVMSAALILIPQHDSIRNPHYWYEGVIVILFSHTITVIFLRMMACRILFELDCLTSLRSFFLMYSALAISTVSLTLAYFAVFVLYLHYDLLPTCIRLLLLKPCLLSLRPTEENFDRMKSYMISHQIS